MTREDLTKLRPGWLRDQLEAARREVDSWPEWKRALIDEEVRRSTEAALRARAAC